jgi:hypothetical protein
MCTGREPSFDRNAEQSDENIHIIHAETEVTALHSEPTFRRPARFNLAINLKTAKALSLTFSRNLSPRANEVFE